jgi:hypothetical protein
LGWRAVEAAGSLVGRWGYDTSGITVEAYPLIPVISPRSNSIILIFLSLFQMPLVKDL